MAAVRLVVALAVKMTMMVVATASPITDSQILNDTWAFMTAFRDPLNGLFCDSLSFEEAVCGDGNNVYSSAAVGMGLIADVVAVELGLLDRDAAEARALQTLGSLHDKWPREPYHGFFVHFTNRVSIAESEYSTIDTAEMAAGAIFSANYLGSSEVRAMAEALVALTDYPAAIEGADGPTIYSIVNGSTGEMEGMIRPFNEYGIVAYMAMKTSNSTTDPSGKAKTYWSTYYAAESDQPPPGDGIYPVHLNYGGWELLTDSETKFMSSFIPQFLYYMTKPFGTSKYYMKLLSDWMLADMTYWSLAMPDDAKVRGVPGVNGNAWGCGAGLSPSGYSVERIDDSKDLVFSAPIMAGFLGAAKATNTTLQKQINQQLDWLIENNVCAYKTALPAASNTAATVDISVLWRCSVTQPDWRAASADLIDYATMLLGYAENWLPSGFYTEFAI